MSEFIRKHNILILAEGYEEKPYIDKVLSFPNINKTLYSFGNTINVKGNGNIVARYQYELQRGFYDIVLIFCDADKGSEQFLDLVYTIGEKYFVSPDKGFEVFIFANPVTLQVVLSHFGDVKTLKVGKKSNKDIIEKLVGIKDYSANQSQISELIGKIHYSSKEEFKNRLKDISSDFNITPSTNFLTFLERFESKDPSWIEQVNKLRKGD